MTRENPSSTMEQIAYSVESGEWVEFAENKFSQIVAVDGFDVYNPDFCGYGIYFSLSNGEIMTVMDENDDVTLGFFDAINTQNEELNNGEQNT